MAKLIGTAGHVDHGKTTLIRALTGIDADRLPEEKERGMTIDIGFAYLDVPGHGRVSIVDVPGHERFLSNMLVGALGIDVALLCVAADESVMPQTREHLQILELLPVDKLVVALTRSDLVDQETLEFARLESEELVGKTRFGKTPIAAVSAVSGVGIDALKQELAAALGPEGSWKEGPWYLPIDRAFSVKGHGCVVTGTLAQGTVTNGEQAFLEPGHLEVRIRAIHVHGEPQETSEKGKRTALNLGGISLEDVHRGQALGAPGSLFETSCLDVRIHRVAPIKHGLRVRVSVGADEAIGKIFLSAESDEVAQLRLEQPIACAQDQPLIIRRYSPPDVLAGGRVIVPQARPRRKSEKAVVIDATDDREAILQAVGETPDGVPTDEVCRVLGRSPQALGDVFEKLQREGLIRGFAGLWLSSAAFAAGSAAFFQALEQVHAAAPNQRWVPREKVVSVGGLKWAGKPLDRIIAALATEGRLLVNGTTVRHLEFTVQLTPRQRQFLDRALEALQREVINTPGAHDLARILTVPPQAAEEILKVGVDAGELVTIGDGIFYTPAQLERLKATIADFAKGKPFPASAIRDHLQTTRKYVIPLLEYFDSIRFTLRVGDQRVVQT